MSRMEDLIRQVDSVEPVAMERYFKEDMTAEQRFDVTLILTEAVLLRAKNEGHHEYQLQVVKFFAEDLPRLLRAMSTAKNGFALGTVVHRVVPVIFGPPREDDPLA